MNNIDSPWLIGRKEIAAYSRSSVWSVTAMVSAGMRCSGGKVKGQEVRTKREWVDDFLENNPDFRASDYHQPKPRVRSI